MSTLHIVNRSGFQSDAFENALAQALTGDAILLIEDGIYCAANTPASREKMSCASAGLRFYVLQEDMSARALPASLEMFQAISYAQFVELVCEHKNSVSWS